MARICRRSGIGTGVRPIRNQQALPGCWGRTFKTISGPDGAPTRWTFWWTFSFRPATFHQWRAIPASILSRPTIWINIASSTWNGQFRKWAQHRSGFDHAWSRAHGRSLAWSGQATGRSLAGDWHAIPSDRADPDLARALEPFQVAATEEY
ncbi:hypothetical protein SAMN05216387_103284 [Nitrosovibrio tenuis]|uniref:Uncharacterized protein n=1 Tax=Nitrosovibrio tenuis TaxID=1233 RepID=A0A1H7KQ34_9PROT|nr:hypothetical protein SAMN05216387_103284 [Nitrosovibrio tenuis]